MASPSLSQQPAGSKRHALWWGVVLVLMAGLLLSWTQAQAENGPAAQSELGHFVPAEPVDEFSHAGRDEASVSVKACRKPVLLKTTAVDLVLNEMSDKDIPSLVAALWPQLLHTAPRLCAVAEMPQIARAPLLRPPARLV